MSSNVNKWKRTNKRVMSLLNSSFEENTLNTDIDDDDHATVEVNSLNDSFVSTNEFMLSSSGSNSELNSESHSNSDGEPKNSSPNALVSDSNSDVSQVHNTLENNSANLVFNIDGLPLFKSSGTQLWPILAYFNTFDIFIIAIYGGGSKPSPLSEF